MTIPTAFRYRVIASTVLMSVGILALGLVHVLYAPLDSVFTSPPAVIVDTGPVGVPTVIHIPRLEVEAVVRALGVTSKGTIAAPARYADVGWYQGSVKPGEAGSAVLSGHFDNGLGLPGVFYELGKVKVGDQIVVEDSQGSSRTFIVADLKSYPYNQPLSAEFLDSGGNAELRLITCSGSWLPAQKTYDNRLVVIARLAGE